MDDKIVRRATEKDMPLLAALIEKNLNINPPKGIGKKHIVAYTKGNATQALIKNFLNHIVILTVDITVVGFAIIGNHIIEFFIIDNDYQRQGNGSYLFQKLFEEPYLMRAMDFYAKDTATKCFVEKHGWEPRWKFYRNGEDIDKFTYIAPMDDISAQVNYNDPHKKYIRDLW